jgi:hypothetical protein
MRLVFEHGGHAQILRRPDRFRHLPLTLTGPNLLTTQWEVDAFGRVLAEYRADGTWTETTRAWCTTATCPEDGKLKRITTTPGAPDRECQKSCV